MKQQLELLFSNVINEKTVADAAVFLLKFVEMQVFPCAMLACVARMWYHCSSK